MKIVQCVGWSYGNGGFDVWMWIVINQFEVLILEVEDALHVGVDFHLGQAIESTAKAIDIHPRTAFGLSRDRKTFVILAVDGRQPGYSEGATCADLADILLREGCADAINMDGGGSTSLVIYDHGRNCPLMLNRHANGYVRKTALNLGLIFPTQ